MMLDNAREQGVDVHEGARVLEVLFEGDRAVGVRIQNGGRRAPRDVARKVVVDASGQSTLLQNRFKLRLWDPDAEQGRDLDLLAGRLPRHRPGRRRDHGHADRPTSKAGSGTSRSTTTPSASAWSRRSITCSRAAAVTSRPTTRKSSAARRSSSASAGPSGRPATSPRKDYSYRSKQVAGQRLGAGRRCLRLPRSAVLLRRAAGAEIGRAGRRRHRRGPGAGRRVGAAQLGKLGRRCSTRASTACAGWSASTTTASASASSFASFPHLRGTITDLLIGDLFTDRSMRCGGRWSRSTSRARRPFLPGTPEPQSADLQDKAPHLEIAGGTHPVSDLFDPGFDIAGGCSFPRPISPASRISARTSVHGRSGACAVACRRTEYRRRQKSPAAGLVSPPPSNTNVRFDSKTNSR